MSTLTGVVAYVIKNVFSRVRNTDSVGLQYIQYVVLNIKFFNLHRVIYKKAELSQR